MDYRIFPPEDILETSLALPLSKSISARALVMAALGADAPTLTADCTDTEAIKHGLAAQSGTIDIGAAGTAMRFLTAFYAATPGCDVTLDGCERMRHRPIAPLVDTLRALGADISYAGEEGFPPLRIAGRRLSGGEISIDSTVSSQFISAVLMVAPTMERTLTLKLDGDTVSAPYIRMTAEMMRRRGINVDSGRFSITVEPGSYTGGEKEVEGDWSAAAFWYEIAALTAGWVTLSNLSADSIQGDKALSEIFPRLGVLTEFGDEGAELSATPDIFSRLDLDMTDTPDLVQPLAVTACAIGVPFTLKGVAALRHKETDRLAALCSELLKLGCVVETEGDNILSWEGRRLPVGEMPVIDTFGDHRMAMAFAPVSVFVPGLVIRDAEVVDKSYPGYWDQLREAGFIVTDAAQTE